MYIKYSKYAFFRKIGNYVNLFNQLNYSEHYYNEDAIDFISSITKEPQKIYDIVKSLSLLYNEPIEEIHNDFMNFVNDLLSDGFLISAQTVKELSEKEPKFTYKGFVPQKITDTEAAKIQGQHIEEIEQFGDLYIEELTLELTKRCNERCIHCYIPNNEKESGHFITLKDAKNYIRQARDLGIWKVIFTGGEPFLHPQINEIVKYTRELDMIFMIASNLTFLNDKHIEVLKETYPFFIQVSLYSLDSEVHDNITGVKGSLKRTMDSLNKCFENDIPLQVNCPVIEANKNCYQETIEWAWEKGINAKYEFEMFAQTDFKRINMNSSLRIDSLKKIYKQLLENDKVSLNNYNENIKAKKQSQNRTNRHVCGGAISKLFITSNGKVLPCPGWTSMELGDLSKDTLDNIYKSKIALEVRRLTLQKFQNKFPPELLPFIKLCPAHFANSNNGDYMKIPADVIENARIKQQVVNELVAEVSAYNKSTK